MLFVKMRKEVRKQIKGKGIHSGEQRLEISSA